ncbi:Txe/YoeB family addiction module toxin [Acaryochloris sp. CCMEE 5410]|uniref:Txe/YoeB family addiction module toxin n=1 Tax=Acaryochloris sp. CCMEE 5410 TaxID=310037 RepID=UPI000248497E|nr:Txe/YoeB family addiction module toxin [Acaryochloris sp. CCMEE 5410]KAI9130749.1 Txe/YoeB family addiction module toxin [Acaryochloris sp. CCMEE 5410]
MGKKKAKFIPSEVKWEIILDPNFREDLQYWIQQDRKLALRLMVVVESIATDPFTGIGKPEALKHLGSNLWSRRLNQEHRIVNLVRDGKVYLLAEKYHY